MTTASITTKKDRGRLHNWLSRRQQAGQGRERKVSSVRLQLEQLESRDLMSGVWTILNHLAPAGVGTMMLLTDGTVIAQESGTTKKWDRLTPDALGSYVNGTWSPIASMNTVRLYFGSNVLPSGKVFVVGGEYTDQGNVNSNLSETYDPVADKWNTSATFPQSQFGDDPTEILPNGKILAGYINDGSTYIYDPTTDTWSPTGAKLGNDRSDEETWIKLPDGSILSYDVNSLDNHAQRYVPSLRQWVDAGVVPVPLSLGFELGPALLLTDGRVFQIGANGKTALYTPPTDLTGSGTWAVGPSLPAEMGADDAPGAILPNGHVLFAADSSSPKLSQNPTEIFDFDGNNTITQVTTPTLLANSLNNNPAFGTRMLMLPTGQMLFASFGGSLLYVYTPDVTTNPSWQPTISGVTDQGGGNFLLTGTRLTGISEGASYGDDAEMASNYPIVQLKDGSGNVFYARTTNWSYTGVSAAGDSTVQTVDFALPKGLALGNYTLTVIANGIASASTPFTVGVSKIALVDLSGAFNNTGIVNDGSRFSSTGGLDGSGHAISSNLVTSPVRWNQLAFNIGAVNGANPNVVTAAGQVVTLPAGKFGTLNLLATGINGDQTGQTFTVTYTDGTKLNVTPSVSDWFTPPNDNGQSEAVTMPYRDNYDGSRDSRTFYVYGYSFTLDSSKTVQSITLPNDSNIKILAMTLGAAVAPPTGTPVDLSPLFASYGSEAITNDGTSFPSTNGFDGGGHAYSSSSPLGTTVVWNNLTFNLGPFTGNDDVEALGQTLSLPAGTYASLNLLAATPYNPVTNITFTVTYSDGTHDTFTRSFSTWTAPAGYSGESTAFTMTYQNTSSGGRNTVATYLHGYTFLLNTQKLVQSITFPNASSVKILAMTLGAAVAPPAGTPVDLSPLFASYGSEAITNDGTSFPSTNGFDGGGHAYSSSNPLGSTVVWNNLTFNLGPFTGNDDVEALGQTLSLPAGTYASLNLLAATPYNPVTNVTFTVTYSDGTHDTFTRSFSTWTAPAGYSGESTAFTMTYQNTSSGGRNTVATYLHGYTFLLNTQKLVQSITFPNASSVKILAITLAPVHTMSPLLSSGLATSTTSGAAAGSPSAVSAQPNDASSPVSLIGERPAIDPFSSYSSLFAFLPSANGNPAGQTSTESSRPASSLSTSDLAFLPEYPGAFPDNTVGKKDNWDFQRRSSSLENSDQNESLTPADDNAVWLLAKTLPG